MPFSTMWLLLGLFFLLLDCSLADKPCNGFVDKVLEQLKADKEFFEEPFEIPEEDKSFGIYHIDYGHVYGFNTLHRDGDVVPLAGDKKHLKVYLGAGELKMETTGKRRIYHFGQAVSVVATVPYVSMELVVVPKEDGTNPEITNFQIDEVKGLQVKVSGLGPLRNLLLNAFVRLIGRFFRKMVRRSVEDRFRNFLTDKVKEFPIPKECLADAWE